MKEHTFKQLHKVCPDCKRGRAMSKPEMYGEGRERHFVRVCRYCGYEKVSGRKEYRWGKVHRRVGSMYIEARVIDRDTGNTYYTKIFRDCASADTFRRINTDREQVVKFRLKDICDCMGWEGQDITCGIHS